jgi:hypothetical protein
MSYALGAALGSAYAANRDLADWQEAYYKLENYRNQDLQTIAELQRTIDKLKREQAHLRYFGDRAWAHYASERALRVRAMLELDEASGGKDKNPLRQPAYKNPDEMRIPSGKRKGEVVTLADHIYLKRFAANFKKFYLTKWVDRCKSWKDFLHPEMCD